MRNKMILFAVVIVVLFGALYFVIDYKNKETIEDSGNPYGTKDLQQETIDQLDDPLYQNQVTPIKLDEMINNKEDFTVYYYSPTCVHCQNTTPIVVPLAEDLDIEVNKLNLLEFDDKWEKYKIEGTPTLVHYKGGEEADRISGEQSEEIFQSFFEEVVLE